MAPGRLQAIAGLRGAMAGALDLLGLQRDAPGVLLAELRALALVRCLPLHTLLALHASKRAGHRVLPEEKFAYTARVARANVCRSPSPA